MQLFIKWLYIEMYIRQYIRNRSKDLLNCLCDLKNQVSYFKTYSEININFEMLVLF